MKKLSRFITALALITLVPIAVVGQTTVNTGALTGVPAIPSASKRSTM